MGEPMFSIRVRNSKWYWTTREIKEGKEKGNLSIEEFHAFNEDKVHKHTKVHDFSFKLGNTTIEYDSRPSFELVVYAKESLHGPAPRSCTILLDNVTKVQVNGTKGNATVVVSNELIHQMLHPSSDQSCFYLYLNPGTERNMIDHNIWIADRHLNKILDELGDFAIESTHTAPTT